MAQSDRKKLHEVTDNALSLAGGMIAVRVVCSMLLAIEQRFDDAFTIDGAVTALDRLIDVAQTVKLELLTDGPCKECGFRHLPHTNSQCSR